MLPSFSQKLEKTPFNGRWDLTIQTPMQTYPSWMEFDSMREFDGVGEGIFAFLIQIVGRVSSVHSASNIAFNGSRLTFTSTEWFGKPTKVTWDLTAANGKLIGTQTREDGTVGQITGVPAPALNRPVPAAWTKPEPLFDDKSLNGWEPFNLDGHAPNHWVADHGNLLNQSPGANLRTTRKFNDFKLHIEYNCPQNGNSGVYLRGR